MFHRVSVLTCQVATLMPLYSLDKHTDDNFDVKVSSEMVRPYHREQVEAPFPLPACTGTGC